MALNLGELYGSIGLDVGPLEKGVAKGESILKSFAGRAGVLAAGIGGAVGVTIGASVLKGMDMEPALDKMNASLGLTVEQAEKASYAAGVAYSHNWGASMDEAAAATGAVISSVKGMADASEDELVGMTEDVLAFASAFEIDVTRAAQVAGQMMNTGLVSNAQEGLDLLTVALQKVPAAVREDVMDAADEYGPFFASMGIKGEEAMSMLVAASEKGMYGIDKTGDAVKEFTIRATDMSKTTGAAYETLGLDQTKMTNALLKGGEEGAKAFDQIVAGILKIKDPAAQSQAALALFGTPLEDLSVQEIPAFLKSLQGVTGGLGDTEDATMRMGAAMSDNAASNIETARRTVEMFAVETIGGQFLPALTDVTGKLANDVGPALATGVENLKGFGEWIQKNQSWLLPLGVAFGILAAAIGLANLQMGIAAGGGFIAWIGSVTKVTAAWNAIQLLLNTTFLANPIALVIVAIMALVAAFIVAYNTSEDFRNIVNGAFEAIAGAGRWLWNNGLAPVIRFILNGFADVTDGIGDFLIALSNIPGFGWAGDAGRAMKGAAAEARGLAASIRDIPATKAVKVTIGVHTVYTTTGVSTQGQTVYRTGNGALFEAAGGVLRFADAGIMPGWTPGRDVHRFYSPSFGELHLSGGEAVMRPEFTAAVGESRINRWNAAARSGGIGGVRAALAYAGGTANALRTPAWGAYSPEQGGRGFGDGGGPARAAELRAALDGLRVDIANGRLFFRGEMASYERSSDRVGRARTGAAK